MEPKVFLDEIPEIKAHPDAAGIKRKIDDIYRRNDVPGEVVRLSRTVDNALATLNSFQVLSDDFNIPTIEISTHEGQVEPTKTVAWRNYPTTFKDKYLFIKGKHRLGKIRSATLVGLCWLPLSLGFSWFTWLSKAFQELMWHTFSRFDYKRFLPPMGCCLIFGFHFYFVNKLALLLAHAERQNGYVKTSARVATVLAVFPPLAVFYLQRRMNEHWKLHVTNHIWDV
ncbi:MAG: hypothetical protein AB7T49_03245 [Oligoflexales bacterium]